MRAIFPKTQSPFIKDPFKKAVQSSFNVVSLYNTPKFFYRIKLQSPYKENVFDVAKNAEKLTKAINEIQPCTEEVSSEQITLQLKELVSNKDYTSETLKQVNSYILTLKNRDELHLLDKDFLHQILYFAESCGKLSLGIPLNFEEHPQDLHRFRDEYMKFKQVFQSCIKTFFEREVMDDNLFLEIIFQFQSQSTLPTDYSELAFEYLEKNYEQMDLSVLLFCTFKYIQVISRLPRVNFLKYLLQHYDKITQNYFDWAHYIALHQSIFSKFYENSRKSELPLLFVYDRAQLNAEYQKIFAEYLELSNIPLNNNQESAETFIEATMEAFFEKLSDTEALQKFISERSLTELLYFCSLAAYVSIKSPAIRIILSNLSDLCGKDVAPIHRMALYQLIRVNFRDDEDPRKKIEEEAIKLGIPEIYEDFLTKIEKEEKVRMMHTGIQIPQELVKHLYKASKRDLLSLNKHYTDVEDYTLTLPEFQDFFWLVATSSNPKLQEFAATTMDSLAYYISKSAKFEAKLVILHNKCLMYCLQPDVKIRGVVSIIRSIAGRLNKYEKHQLFENTSSIQLFFLCLTYLELRMKQNLLNKYFSPNAIAWLRSTWDPRGTKPADGWRLQDLLKQVMREKSLERGFEVDKFLHFMYCDIFIKPDVVVFVTKKTRSQLKDQQKLVLPKKIFELLNYKVKTVQLDNILEKKSNLERMDELYEQLKDVLK